MFHLLIFYWNYRAVALCIGKIIEKEPDIGKKYLLFPIVDSLFIFSSANFNGSTEERIMNPTTEEIVAKEEDITRSVSLFYFLIKNNEIPPLSNVFYDSVFPGWTLFLLVLIT